MDAKVDFAPLDPAVMGQIVDKFIGELRTQLAERKVDIQLTDAARAYLAEKGYDPLNGARPLARVIQEFVKKPLAEELLFGKLVKGGAVKVNLKDGTLSFDYVEAAPPALPRPEEGDGEAEKEPEVVVE